MNKIYLSALALIAGASISAQVNNAGFENWTTGSPNDWINFNITSTIGDITDGSTNVITPATEVTTGATEGNSFAKLTSFNLANSTDATNYPDGDYGSILVQDIVSTDKYEDFTFDVKYDVKPNDTAIFIVQAYDGAGNLVGAGSEIFGGTQNAFSTVTVDMNYIGAVTEYTVFIASSEGQIFNNALSTLAPGSWISVDNIVVGAIIPNVPDVTNVLATDISDNEDGSDLELTFDIPDESNINAYYVVAMQSNVSPFDLSNAEAFIAGSGVMIATTGANQTFNFTAAGEYWRINAAGDAVENVAIEEDVEMKIYVLVEAATGYSSVIATSNAITLTSPVSVTDQYKEISIYPNPANNFVNFKIDGLENGTVIINSVTGQEVVNTTISNGMKQVDVSNLNNGVYIYTIRNNNNEVIKTNKLVVRK
ncbi:T9SS type A sorting domain-containing protein [Brumimicrobium glaciale]|uniref:T9SS type A sorting domain-containing protein n=1 Tax=Brumimicrobium glaciale TaxID=200475 RepID=A0A4Q4KMR0_9FLAO|nr:T9SS type A sorting domain-containing protein [Brumimicrobium glaciale]RYM34691.1 T9SS type A sorting domain-containing protein [Brumimicrobium glaciale]